MMIRPVNNNKIGQVKRANAIRLSAYMSIYLKGCAHISLIGRQTIRKVIESKRKEKERQILMVSK